MNDSRSFIRSSGRVADVRLQIEIWCRGVLFQQDAGRITRCGILVEGCFIGVTTGIGMIRGAK